MAHPLVHWELIVSSTEKARNFYGKVFDWTFDDKTYPGYTLIRTGRDAGAGLMAKRSAAPAMGANTYFEVSDVQLTLQNVIESGGTVIVPKTEISNLGTFAMFQDPEGIAVGVLQPLRH
ncbi:MAG: VOC family protein [Archangium sp.]|nr:VOC family protein [Archangium sp.]